MKSHDTTKIPLNALLFLLLASQVTSFGQVNSNEMTAAFPSAETLVYRIEWRMVTAGQAKLQMSKEQQNWVINMNLQSAGLVSRLYKINDNYKVTSNERFCGESSSFESEEGKHRLSENMVFDNSKHKATFDKHDLTKNEKEHHEVDIAPCTHEILGALASVRLGKLEPGKSITLPIVNAKKMANAKIEAQAKEKITLDGKSYETTRYEAYIFDNVVFRRKGSLHVWLSEDAGHVPLQLRFEMGFPIGNVTLELEKAEKN